MIDPNLPHAPCVGCGTPSPSHPDGASCRKCYTDELARHGVAVCSYTVIVPPALPGTLPTPWHANYYRGTPAEQSATLQRGTFATESEAHGWALANLIGHRYTVRWIDSYSGETREIPGDFRVTCPGLWALAWIGRAVASLVWWGMLHTIPEE